METKILEMAVAQLSEEVDKLKSQLSTVCAQMTELLEGTSNQKAIAEDEVLWNYKEVQSKLGICYTSLSKLIKQGLIKPIRINQRRIRFSKISILRYIKEQS
jgi:predicted DNA-binding transcriptional regulator AlpA